MSPLGAAGARVTALMTKPARKEPMLWHDAVTAIPHEGLVGDCHAHPLGPRQVLVVRQEDLDRHRLAIWQVRANIAVEGLSSADLSSGNELQVGESSRIRITHECEVCKVLRQYVPGETFPKLPGQRGSLGVFIAGGELRLHDRVSVQHGQYSQVPERIYDRLAWLVERIPSGSVVTYAALLQLIGAARPYSRVMPTYIRRAAESGLPAHRVLTTAEAVTGRLEGQAGLLAAEGVPLSTDGALLDRAHLWNASRVYLD